MDVNKRVREALEADKAGFCRLWRICFGDSEKFCRWLFDNRFYPQYSACIEDNGKIISAMQAVPYRIMIRDHPINGVMLCGVSTHPDQRKKGYMGQLFTYEMQALNKKGVLAAIHTPAVLESYFPFGHYPVAGAGYIKGITDADSEDSVLLPLPVSEWHKLFPLYKKNISEKYSGSILRTRAEFLRKGDDYGADGGEAFILQEKGEIAGYAFLYKTKDELIVPETVANEGMYHKLVGELKKLAKGRKISIKLPPDISIDGLIIEEKGVAGLVNISGLLGELKIDCPYSVEVVDNVVPENNGVFDFSGNRTERPPAIKLSAGHFLQVIFGYIELNDIKEFVTVYEQAGYNSIRQALPKEPCYVIDEY